MNHLGHFYLAHPHRDLMVGGFLGDFVKGRLTAKRPQQIEAGIQLHRAIDVFTDQHAIVKQSQRHFDPEFRRYAGIITDIVFDHFLARHWPNYSSVSLGSFSQSAYQSVLDARSHLPEKALQTITWMQSSLALERYREEVFIDGALNSIAKRLTRKNPLDRGFEQFQQNKVALMEGFSAFMPEVKCFADQWIANLQRPVTSTQR